LGARAVSESLEKLRSEALEALDRGDWDRALHAAGEWYRSTLLAIEAGRFLDNVESRVRDGPRAEASESEPVREDHFESLKSAAETAESDELWSLAIRNYDEMLRIRPRDPEIESRRSRAREQLRASLDPTFSRARVAVARGDLRAAGEAYEKLCQLLPWDLEPVREWQKLGALRSSARVESRRKNRGRGVLYAGAAIVLLVVASWVVQRIGVPIFNADGASPGAIAPGLRAEEPSGTGSEPVAPVAQWGTLGGDWTDPGHAGTRRTLRIAGTELVFRWIPPGEIVMGSTESDPCRDADEKPWVARFGTGFWLTETEVTQAQWQAVVGEEPRGIEPCPRCPVGRVDWYDAQESVEALNTTVEARIFRLPYEAEWEYAARAGGDGPYGSGCTGFGSGGCDLGSLPCLDRIAWHRGNARGAAPRPVGLKEPNAWGLHDMQGNVSEWCQDRYGAYPDGARVDYVGPAVGNRRVQCGGGLDDVTELRSTNRSGVSPSYDLGVDTGFRIVLGRARP
jgi:formylglycine-generating enzyme required for sulfatase activity